MKKFIILAMMFTVLGAASAEAFPRHGGRHFHPVSIHRPVVVRHKHHHNGAAWAVAGTIIGASVLANFLAPARPAQAVQTYVPVARPITASNCTSTVINGVTVQNCVTTGY